MANVPDHNNPEIRESEAKVFRQKYYIVDNEFADDHKLREARVEVMADEDGVFLECKEDRVTESLSIPTTDLAVKVAEYILEAYQTEKKKYDEFSFQEIKFLVPETMACITHELWRLSNHITSPHGPVDEQGVPELYGHVKRLCELLGVEPKPHPQYHQGYNPIYSK